MAGGVRENERNNKILHLDFARERQKQRLIRLQKLTLGWRVRSPKERKVEDKNGMVYQETYYLAHYLEISPSKLSCVNRF